MQKFIRNYLDEEGAMRSDITHTVALAKELGRLVDHYGGQHFFMLGDALGSHHDRDARMHAIYQMAWAGHAWVTLAHRPEIADM